MISLQRCVAGNVLFVHLEPDELNDVLDAMFLVGAMIRVAPLVTFVGSGEEERWRGHHEARR